MKKEVLFRGKRVDNGEWVEGLLFKTSFSTVRKVGLASCIQVIEDIYYKTFEINPDTVGEFTGLQDVNKTNIFTGDIVKHRFRRIWQTDEHISTVVWNQELCCYYLNDGTSNHRMRDDMIYEVIGNIYDNPELLK